MTASQQPAATDILSRAREVFDTEIAGVTQVRDGLGDEFVQLIHRTLEVLGNGGKIVLTGVGKSAHISRKISATLASTGALSVFMHPVEAMHGDLGVIAANDIVLAVSYSGETDELLRVIPAIKRIGVPLVAVTGVATSRLAEFAEIGRAHV